MKSLFCVSVGIVLCLVLAPGAFCQTAAPEQTQQAPHQYVLGDPGPMTIERANALMQGNCGTMSQGDAIAAIALATARENARRLYRMPLNYTTLDFLVAEMDSALVPDDGPMAMRAGETIHSPFRIFGVSCIIPNRRSDDLLVLSNANGFYRLEMFKRLLDVPIRRISLPSAPSPVARTVRQVDAVSLPSESAAIPLPDTARAYFLPLTYTTPDFILDELNQAYVPDSGILVLKPGEVVHNGFKVEGVRLIIPNRHDNSLLVFATPEGFKLMKGIITTLDVPAMKVPGVVPSNAGQSKPKPPAKKASRPKRLSHVK